VMITNTQLRRYDQTSAAKWKVCRLLRGCSQLACPMCRPAEVREITSQNEFRIRYPISIFFFVCSVPRQAKTKISKIVTPPAGCPYCLVTNLMLPSRNHSSSSIPDPSPAKPLSTETIGTEVYFVAATKVGKHSATVLLCLLPACSARLLEIETSVGLAIRTEL